MVAEQSGGVASGVGAPSGDGSPMSLRQRAFVLVLCAQVASGIVGGAAPMALPAIREAFDTGSAAIQWYAALYSLGFALVGIGLANTVPVLFSTAGQMKDFPPSMGVAMVATLGYGGLLLGPPLIGFGGEIFGLRAMLGLLIGFAFVIIILSQRALRRAAVQFS